MEVSLLQAIYGAAGLEESIEAYHGALEHARHTGSSALLTWCEGGRVLGVQQPVGYRARESTEEDAQHVAVPNRLNSTQGG
jgi:hypothetical protein